MAILILPEIVISSEPAEQPSEFGTAYNQSSFPFIPFASTGSDILGDLLPITLKLSETDIGVNFPCVAMHEAQSKSLAIHTYPNQDGAKVENMGLNAGQYKFRAIFTNHIFPGTNETWKAGTLFPNVFSTVINYLAQNNTLILQHPVYGDITVQVLEWNYELLAKGPRDGAFVDFTLVRTIDTNFPKLSNNSFPAITDDLLGVAGDLDTSISKTPAVFHPPGLSFGGKNQSFSVPGLSISQFFSKLASQIKKVANLPYQQINALQTDLIQASVGVQQIASPFLTAIPTFVNNTSALVNSTQNAVLNSPILFDIAYTQATIDAITAMISLNNTPSTNANDLLNKSIAATLAMQGHYVSLNTVDVANVIYNLRQFTAQLIRQQQTIANQSPTRQYTTTATYQPTVSITWYQLSKQLNNQIDTLMTLNQSLATQLYVPAYSKVIYEK
jgi:hypothetical protein